MSYEEIILKEQTKQSKYSPGLIELDEIVARVLFSPKHYHNGEILPTAFSPAIFKGLSVLRKKYNFCECLSRTIEILEKDGKNEYCGYAYANVKDIKNIIENNYRIFYLLDSATKDRIGHADIFPIRIKEIRLSRKALNYYIRLKISEVFKIYILKIESAKQTM